MNIKNKGLIVIILIVSLTFTTFSCGSKQDLSNHKTVPNASVRLDSGATIKGFSKNGINNYRGIPYAKQPVQQLRFAPPVMNNIKGEFDATAFGPVCPQPDYDKEYAVSEACLNLNIQTPKNVRKGDKLPVYFWIHGGWFMRGTGNSYDGSSFVKNNVIYVSINYRLNIFGFLATDESYEKYGTTGNLGFLDQVCALKWVKKNIESFGGDPDNITVGGESAGSYSASGMLISKKSKGLARRVVLESGTIFSLPELSGGTMAKLENAVDRTSSFFLGQGITNTSLDFLRSLPTQTFLDNLQNPTFTDATTLFLPTLDGEVFPKKLNLSTIKRSIQKSDCLIIHNTEEGRSFVPETIKYIHYERIIKSLIGSKKTRKLYSHFLDDLYKNPLFFQRDVAGLLLFLKGQAMLSTLQDDLGGKCYVVNFGFLNSKDSLDSNVRGAAHTSELDFVFNRTSKLSKEAIPIANETNFMISSFIKDGKLRLTSGDLILKPYTSIEHNALSITATGFSIIPEQHGDDIDYIDKLLLLK